MTSRKATPSAITKSGTGIQTLIGTLRELIVSAKG